MPRRLTASSTVAPSGTSTRPVDGRPMRHAALMGRLMIRPGVAELLGELAQARTGATAAPPGRGRTARRAGSPRPAPSPVGVGQGGPSSSRSSRAVPSRQGVHLPHDSRVLKASSVRTASRTGSVVVERDDAARARVDGAARDQRLVELARGHDAARRAAHDGRLERPAASTSRRRRPRSSVRQRAADLHLDDARAAATSPDRPKQLGAAAAAEAREPARRPARRSSGTANSVSTLLMTVGRPKSPDSTGNGGRGARHRAPALDRLQQRRLLAEHEAAGAAADLDLEREVGAEHALRPTSPHARACSSGAGQRARPTGRPRRGRRGSPGAAPAANAASSTPSSSRCGSPSIRWRSLKMPGLALLAVDDEVLRRAAGARGTPSHFTAVWK